MKKHLSVFGLYARSSIFKILGVLLLMCAAENAFFRIELQKALTAYDSAGLSMASLEQIFVRSAVNVYFRVALVLITVIICLPGCAFKSRTDYTLRRLSVTERAIFFHQAIYNGFVYILLFAVQLVVAFGLARYYISTVPTECITNQTIMLAFWRNRFLHSLLPLGDVGLWIRNVLLIISFSLAAAEIPYLQRRHKFSSSVIWLTSYTVVFFNKGIGQGWGLERNFQVLAAVIITAMVIRKVVCHLMKKEKEEAEHD